MIPLNSICNHLNTHCILLHIGGRKLKEEQRKLAKQAISCDQCKAYECYAAENADDQVQSREELDEAVADWIDELVECKETGVYWNDMALYVSAMCTPYGDGVELAVFVDDECTMYTNQQSFYDVWDPSNDNENGVNYLTYAEEILKSSFSEVTACSELQYGYPDGYAGDDADEDGDDEENEMNEYCQEVLEGDNFVDFNNCGAADNDDAGKRSDMLVPSSRYLCAEECNVHQPQWWLLTLLFC